MRPQDPIPAEVLNSIAIRLGFSSPTFPADWHPQLGEKLALFPPCLRLGERVYWPDFATFIDEPAWLRMAYYSEGISPYSALIVASRTRCAWRVCEYRDADLVRSWEAQNLEGVFRPPEDKAAFA